jgi:hypothetical protein
MNASCLLSDQLDTWSDIDAKQIHCYITETSADTDHSRSRREATQLEGCRSRAPRY